MSPRYLLTVVLVLLTRSLALGELQIGAQRWGFDGTVSKNAFNVLSIEIRNTGAGSFDGDVALDDSPGGRSSAPYSARIFLAPGTVRWVQFFPYVGNYIPEWRLTWTDGKREGRADLNAAGEQLKQGPPAIVLLIAADDPTLRSARMPLFDEALFPPTVAATDGLHAVLLDHQPKLDPARRDAFLDWIRAGGIVHLLPGPGGTFPEFTDEYAPLNFTTDTTRIGAGLVAKHATSRSEITPATLAAAGYPEPKLPAENNQNQYNDPATRIFSPLAGLTKPDINWPLIYLLTVLYVALIGPTFYMLRRRDYRVLLGGFILTVAAFAWIFTIVGRRGYGEKQIYHSVGIAHALGGGRWDVRHWTHAFATSGDKYQLAYPGPGQLYAALSSGGDNVRATVVHGKDSALLAEIPLFSSRPFLHRGTLSGPDLGLAVGEMKSSPNSNDNLSSLTFTTGPAFPKNPIRAAAEYRGNTYTLTRTGTTLTGGGLNSSGLRSALGSQDNDENDYYYYNRTSSPSQSLDRLRALAGNLVNPRFANSRPQSPDTIRIYIYAEAPADFRLTGDQFQSGTGFILYIQDVPVPAK